MGIMGENWKEALAGRFGDDLEVLVRQLDGEIESAEELTRLTSDRQTKASFKLIFKDGRLFKARRFKTIDDWSSVVALSPLLDELHFSRVIAGYGMATVEEWVAGYPLSMEDVTETQARGAGALLGHLHTITDLPTDLLPRAPDGNWYTDAINTHLAALVEQGVLESVSAQKIYEAAVHDQPARFAVGLIHGDFCADNMIVKEDSEIVVIDNETLRLGALDFDIARCWCRWPMTEPLRRAFAEGYQRYRTLEGIDAHREFWAIKALSQSVFVHVKHKKRCQPALDALKRIGSGARGDLWPHLPERLIESH